MAHRLLNSFKAYADLDVANTAKDDKISLALTAAETFINNRYNIMLESKSFVETLDGNGTNIIRTTYRIASLVSVLIDGIDNGLANYSIKDNTIRLISGKVTKGYGNIIVTYMVGYNTLPQDLELALYKLANKLYTDADEAREGVNKFSTDTKTGITYIAQNLPTSFETLINPYRIIDL